MDYSTKSYGRNSEVDEILGYFKSGKDVSKHGPRRLGKTFVLDRLVEKGPSKGFKCVKVEVAGCRNVQMVFQRICEEINSYRTLPQRASSFMHQRIAQAMSPRSNTSGPWYIPFLSLDWEAHLEKILARLSKDKTAKWAILIDELPIFLKALHDKGDDGIKEARDFMNLFSSLRSNSKGVRWLVTGSIGIEPLAKKGEYIGVMSKFTPYPLPTLTQDQSVDYIQDLAALDFLPHRTVITTEEANAIIETVGWRAAYYLEAFASQFEGSPSSDPIKIKTSIEAAIKKLISPHNLATFGTWEEHISKHYSKEMQSVSFAILNSIATHPLGLRKDQLAVELGVSASDEKFTSSIEALINDGFLYHDDTNSDYPLRFRIALLRLWWERFPAKANR